MKVEADASWPEATPARSGRLLDLTGPVRRLVQRLRDWRFWAVQALVMVITVLHSELEATEALGEQEALSFVPVSFYFIPIVYAGLNFGMEGALPTALWSAGLAMPNVFVWHTGLQRFGELLQLAIMVVVAIVVARRVDAETRHRLRAEKTSASLSLLNEIGESLSHTLDVEERLPGVLRRLLSALPLRAAWLCLEPEADEGELLVIAESSGSGSPAPTGLARELHRRLASAREPVTADEQAVAVPLLMEAGVMGSLGATPAAPEPLSDEQLELMMTVAHQISVAVENARLYRQRQESMQSYVRRITEAQEEERLRIARDLHDDTAQELVGLVRRLEQLRDTTGASAAPIDELLDHARTTLHSVRRYSRDLRPSVLDDLGLVAALETLVEGMDGRLSGGAQLRVAGAPRRLDSPVELALFRIAQEALRNIEKHAGATSATVELDFGKAAVRLAVSDNGRGFAPPRTVSNLARLGKLGLLGMKERAELVGGSFELSSSRGRGTNLAVTVATEDGQR